VLPVRAISSLPLLEDVVCQQYSQVIVAIVLRAHQRRHIVKSGAIDAKPREGCLAIDEVSDIVVN
jgi:hypothetical protein